MKNSIYTSPNTIGSLLDKCIRHSISLLFVTAILVSIIMTIGLWYNNEYATHAIISGVQPSVVFGLIAFALAIPLADLFGSVCKLSYLFIKDMMNNLPARKLNSNQVRFEIVPSLK